MTICHLVEKGKSHLNRALKVPKNIRKPGKSGMSYFRKAGDAQARVSMDK